MPSKFKIDHNVALPPRNNGGRGGRGYRPAQYPWNEMAPGDSFFLPGAVQTAAQRTDAKEKTLSIQYVKKVLPDSTWATRMVTENGVRGVRVWRVS